MWLTCIYIYIYYIYIYIYIYIYVVEIYTPINIHVCINVSADQGSSQSTYPSSTSKLITQGKAAPSAINNLLGYIRGSGSILKSILAFFYFSTHTLD